MKNLIKRALSLVMCLVLVFSFGVPAVMAEPDEPETETSGEIVSVEYNSHDGEYRDYIITVTGSPLALCVKNKHGEVKATYARDFEGLKTIEKTENGERWTVNTKIVPTVSYVITAVYSVSSESEPYPLIVKYEKHSYTDTVVAPTCLDKGYTLHECSCGYSYVDTYVDALGHDKKTVKQPATCTDNGFIKVVCERCGETLSETPIITEGHKWVTVGTKPDCHNEGFAKDECTACHATRNEQILPKTDHSWTSWVVESEATYRSKGLKKRSCKLCGDVEEVEIPMVVIPVESVSISMSSITLKKGDFCSLYADVLPQNAAYSAELVWSSSNPKAVSVDEYGTVTALKRGTATVTVSTKDGKHSDSCTVKSESIFDVIIRVILSWFGL